MGGGFVYDAGQGAGAGCTEVKHIQNAGALCSQLPTGPFTMPALGSATQINGLLGMQVRGALVMFTLQGATCADGFKWQCVVLQPHSERARTAVARRWIAIGLSGIRQPADFACCQSSQLPTARHAVHSNVTYHVG